jgi:hypothetical protein
MAERVAPIERTIENWCPSRRRFRHGPKDHRPVLQLIRGGMKENLLGAR